MRYSGTSGPMEKGRRRFTSLHSRKISSEVLMSSGFMIELFLKSVSLVCSSYAMEADLPACQAGVS